MRGVIRGGHLHGVGLFLPDLLDRFKRNYPNIEIDLVDMERRLEEALDSATIDLGIGDLNISDRPAASFLDAIAPAVWTRQHTIWPPAGGAGCFAVPTYCWMTPIRRPDVTGAQTVTAERSHADQFD